MKQYLDIARDILENGEVTHTRTGVDTIGVFGRMMKFDLREGSPILTTKRVLWDTIVQELLWFCEGGHNVYDINAPKRIWDDWRAPYTLRREIDIILKRIMNYEPYNGDFIYDTFIGSDQKSIQFKLGKTWQGMMNRCYNPQATYYDRYGAQGISVCQRWHSVTSFIEDAPYLPHWWYKKQAWDEFELDKDYYGSNQYGPTTSVWLSKHENGLYNTRTVPIKVIDIMGREWLYMSIQETAYALGLSVTTVWRYLQYGKPKTIIRGGYINSNEKYEGWAFEKIDKREDYVIRLQLIPDGELGPVYGVQWVAAGKNSYNEGYNQLQRAIQDIKKKPNSRQNIVNAWQVESVDDMALPPCHLSFQLRRYGDRLDLAMYQRSADMCLGVPFNISSYALLLTLIANECRLTPGIFTHFLADAHIYVNHVEVLHKQLEREPYPLPTLDIVVDNASGVGVPVTRITPSDIYLRNYQYHPFLKYEVAV